MIVPKWGDRHYEVSALCRPLLILVALALLVSPQTRAQSIGGGGGISGNGGSGTAGVQIGGDIAGTNLAFTVLGHG